MRRRRKKVKSNFIWEKKSPYLFGIVPFLVVVMTFMIRCTLQIISGPLYNLYQTGNRTELFSHWRSYLLWGASAVMLVLAVLFCRQFAQGLDKLSLVCLGGAAVMAVMTVLSSLLSRHGDLAIYGMYDRAEGMITKLCYLILFLYTMLSCRNETCLKLGLGALSVAVLANAVFGISQFIGHDIFNTQWFGELVIPDSIGGTLSTPGGLFTKMYGLLNHYNYMGSFAATTLPVFGVIALMSRRLRIRIPAAVLAALALMLLLCSTSRAGLIGTAAMVLMAAILFRHGLIRRWKIVLCLFAAFLAVTVAADFATDHAVYERVPQLFDDIKTVLTNTSDREYLDEAPIRDIYSTEEGAEIVLQKGNILKLKREQDGFAFADQNGDPVVYTMNSEEYFVTEDSRFAQLKFSEQNGFYRNNPYTYLRLSYKGTQVVQFYYDDTQLYLAQKGKSEPMVLEEVPVAGFFKGKELIGSMRGYIWGRTIPLLGDHLLLGAGSDCFILEFPQNDVLGKLYAYGNAGIIVDKPHNFFMQIWINEGGVALLAFLTICLWYLWDCLRLYGKQKKGEGAAFGIALCLGVVGYLFAGLFNDSTIMTTTLFWFILGMGVAVNRKYRKESVRE